MVEKVEIIKMYDKMQVTATLSIKGLLKADKIAQMVDTTVDAHSGSFYGVFHTYPQHY